MLLGVDIGLLGLVLRSGLLLDLLLSKDSAIIGNIGLNRIGVILVDRGS